MAAVQNYEFDVKMTCGGCSGAVTRVLDRAKANNEGVDDFKVDLPSQKVTVTGPISYDVLLEKIKKTGKEVRSGKVVGAPKDAAAL